MDEQQRDVVWAAGLDDDRYLVWVERLDDRHGQLIVAEMPSNKQVFSEKVTLSYGASYGPDSADVEAWQKLIEEHIPDPNAHKL